MPKYEILVLTFSFTSNGGVSNFCKNLFSDFGSDFHVDYLLMGNWSNKRKLIKSIFYFIHTLYRLIKRLKGNSYDIIHINPSFKTFSLLRDSLYLLIVSKIGHIKGKVVFFHGWDESLVERVIKNRLFRKLFIYVYKEASVIFVLYSRCKEQLVNMGIEPEKIRVTSAFYKDIGDIERDKNSKVNLLFMSRFVKEKGVEIAAEVAKLLVENGYHDFKFAFAGDGPLFPELKRFIQENDLSKYIDTPGYITGKQKEEILRRSDIFLFPTWYKEGCPAVVLEAMGSGQAVVSTPCAAIPEIVEDGKEGFLCDSKDPKVFYEAVKKLIDDRELLSRMQKTAKQRARENYEILGYRKRMKEVYLSIVNSGSDIL